MQHYNPSISEDMNRILNLKSMDSTNEVAEYIQPTIEITPKCNIVKSANSGTIYTTPSDKDFYLTNTLLSVGHAAADGGTAAFIQGYINGVLTTITRIQMVTLALSNPIITETFNYPIKIDRATAISIGVSGALSDVNANIKGYTVETTKGV
jgi:hypothetical protein